MSASPEVFLVQMPLALREPSIPLAQLHAFLRKMGYKSTIMDMSIALWNRHGPSRDKLWSEETAHIWSEQELPAQVLNAHRGFIESEYLKGILAADKPIVGFSVTSCSFPASLMLSRWIKDARPDALIVFGGQIFTTEPTTPSHILSHGTVDAVVVGDGEYSLAEIADRFRDGRDLSGCRGIYLRDGEGRVYSTGEREPACLDDFPFADYSSFDMSLYGTAHAGAHDLVMMTNRGCPRRCSFCGHRTAWNGFRQMSGERVFAEIQHQRKVMPSLGHSDSEIKFYDLLINGDMRKLGRLCDLLSADPAAKLPWKEANAVVRPEMTYDFCRRLYAAGCRQFIIGLESGSQKVLDLMEKGQTIEQMKTVLKNIDRAGLRTRGNFMFGHPGETEEDFQETLGFLKEMAPYIHEVYASYTFTHLDGRLRRNPEQWGVVPNPRNNSPHAYYWESEDGRNTYPVRLERYLTFKKLASSLGVIQPDGLVMSPDAYINFFLGGYYEYKGDTSRTLEYYRKYLSEDSTNEYVLNKVKTLESSVAPGRSA